MKYDEYYYDDYYDHDYYDLLFIMIIMMIQQYSAWLYFWSSLFSDKSGYETMTHGC